VFCNDREIRRRLERELRSADITVIRGHEKNQLRGVKNTLAVIVNVGATRQWFTESELIDVMKMMTTNNNQIVII
jgi:hypothetical protein